MPVVYAMSKDTPSSAAKCMPCFANWGVVATTGRPARCWSARRSLLGAVAGPSHVSQVPCRSGRLPPSASSSGDWPRRLFVQKTRTRADRIRDRLAVSQHSGLILSSCCFSWLRHAKVQARTRRSTARCEGGSGAPTFILVQSLPFRHAAQRSIQIGPKVLDGLDTHAQPQQRRR